MGVELFHALNRGVDKRTLFLDDQDRARFVHDIYEFNDSAPAGNAYRSFTIDKMMDLRNPSFCFMVCTYIHRVYFCAYQFIFNL